MLTAMDAAQRHQLLTAGQRLLNGGRFRDAHEQWEELWKVSVDPERRWIQGMIQLATALYKLAGARADLCRGLLVKALRKLADAPPSLDGFDLGRLRRDATGLLRALERGEAADPSTIRLVEDGGEEAV
ncbi:MAG: hypothetical protein JWM53_3654 [bacterium]|nr:hypothetical protein [bacterium]